MFKGLITRIFTAIVLVFILVFAWLKGGIYLDLFLLLLCSLGTWEFTRMFLKEDSKAMLYFSIGLSLFIGVLTLFTHVSSFIPFTLSALCVAIVTLFRWSKQEEGAMSEGAAVLVAQLYVPYIILLAADLSAYEQLFIVALPACSDTFAYFTGLSIGKHKIWPEVSPKKSVEGSIGGLIAATIFSVIYLSNFATVPALHFFTPIEGRFTLSYILPFIVLGLILGVLAQLGDFFESALKRHTNIKDSSNILPGHGGILDRLDSIVFVLPAYYAFTSLFPTLRF